MRKESVIRIGALLLLWMSMGTNAGIISDYNKTDASNAGWSILFQTSYGSSFNYQSVLDLVAEGSEVALASSSSDGAFTFDLFGSTTLSVLESFTSTDTTIFADGAYWYRNSLSTGFTLDPDIKQCSADAGDSVCGVVDSSIYGLTDLRLSWHGGNPIIDGGWRSGDNIWLNSDTVWQRYILVKANSVPEPGTLVLFALGLAAIGFYRKRQSD